MNYSIVHRNHFYNTLPHVCIPRPSFGDMQWSPADEFKHIGAAYLFGAAPQRLFEIYDGECKTLEPWQDSPHEVTRVDWNRWLGDKR